MHRVQRSTSQSTVAPASSRGDLACSNLQWNALRVSGLQLRWKVTVHQVSHTLLSAGICEWSEGALKQDQSILEEGEGNRFDRLQFSALRGLHHLSCALSGQCIQLLRR